MSMSKSNDKHVVVVVKRFSRFCHHRDERHHFWRSFCELLVDVHHTAIGGTQ